MAGPRRPAAPGACPRSPRSTLTFIAAVVSRHSRPRGLPRNARSAGHRRGDRRAPISKRCPGMSHRAASGCRQVRPRAAQRFKDGACAAHPSYGLDAGCAAVLVQHEQDRHCSGSKEQGAPLEHRPSRRQPVSITLHRDIGARSLFRHVRARVCQAAAASLCRDVSVAYNHARLRDPLTRKMTTLASARSAKRSSCCSAVFALRNAILKKIEAKGLV